MSGAAAVSAAKNRRTRNDPKEIVAPQQQNKQQKQPAQKVELTVLQALHQHDFRLKRNDEMFKQLFTLTEELKTNLPTPGSNKENDIQETFDLFNERIASIEKYIDEELSKSLSLKEKEDKEGEDVIYEKISGLEKLLKEMKTELVRIQSSARETSVSFIKYKSETDAQMKELKESLKTLAASLDETRALQSASAIELSSDIQVVEDNTVLSAANE
jgi:hypothetical protein